MNLRLFTVLMVDMRVSVYCCTWCSFLHKENCSQVHLQWILIANHIVIIFWELSRHRHLIIENSMSSRDFTV